MQLCRCCRSAFVDGFRPGDLLLAELLPLGEQSLGALVVVDAALEEFRLAGRDGALHQLAITHAAPLVIRPVPGGGIGGTTAGGLPAHLRAVVQGAGNNVRVLADQPVGREVRFDLS